MVEPASSRGLLSRCFAKQGFQQVFLGEVCPGWIRAENLTNFANWFIRASVLWAFSHRTRSWGDRVFASLTGRSQHRAVLLLEVFLILGFHSDDQSRKISDSSAAPRTPAFPRAALKLTQTQYISEMLRLQTPQQIWRFRPRREERNLVCYSYVASQRRILLFFLRERGPTLLARDDASHLFTGGEQISGCPRPEMLAGVTVALPTWACPPRSSRHLASHPSSAHLPGRQPCVSACSPLPLLWFLGSLSLLPWDPKTHRWPREP